MKSTELQSFVLYIETARISKHEVAFGDLLVRLCENLQTVRTTCGFTAVLDYRAPIVSPSHVQIAVSRGASDSYRIAHSLGIAAIIADNLSNRPGEVQIFSDAILPSIETLPYLVDRITRSSVRGFGSIVVASTGHGLFEPALNAVQIAVHGRQDLIVNSSATFNAVNKRNLQMQHFSGGQEAEFSPVLPAGAKEHGLRFGFLDLFVPENEFEENLLKLQTFSVT